MDAIFYISLCISVLKSSGVGWVGGSFSFFMSLTFYVCMVVLFCFFTFMFHTIFVYLMCLLQIHEMDLHKAAI